MCRERRQKTQQIGGGVREGFLEEGALELLFERMRAFGHREKAAYGEWDRGEGLIK